jgi:pyruvate,water dikinase
MGAVYQGIVAELAESARPPLQHVVNSPMHGRLRAVLDRLSPLNLTDPQARDFAPAGCRTLHDVIRFAHERAMQEMFGLGEAGRGKGVAIRLTTVIPLQLYLIDLGGGLTKGLTTCDQVTPGLVAWPVQPRDQLVRGSCHRFSGLSLAHVPGHDPTPW